MNWGAFKTYEMGYRSAFETLNNQLFERYIKRTYGPSLVHFRVINGAGGDGGVEAYAAISSGDIIAVQSKWFLQSLSDNEIGQIKKSILTAKIVRPQIKEYIICIPHDVNSQKIGRGKTITVNHEEKKINDLIDEINGIHPDLTLTWWFDNELLSQLQQPDNEGVHKYWFEKEIIAFSYLKDHFTVQKQNNWLKERYIPELHGSGNIYKQYQNMVLAKEYRNELSEKLHEKSNKLTHCQKLISDFLETNEYPQTLRIELKAIYINLKEFTEEITALQTAIVNGNESFQVRKFSEKNLWPATLELEKIVPTHRQKAILPHLIKYLRDIHATDLPNYLIDFNSSLKEIIKLIRGGAGTGKTHGLANCTEKHLENGLPALIVQAKNTPCSNWTDILSHSLELPTWNKNEIFSALESIAISRDVYKASKLAAGEELLEPTSKVLICIDGLEEEAGKYTDWCSRISETTILAERYPRLRFLFSAREYFPRHCIDAYNKIWEEVDLPREGDVSIWDVAEQYLDRYKIIVSNLALVKGLDSLLALRLFCEQYAGQTVTSSTRIVTATRDLLKLKVDRINREFLTSLQHRKGATQQPVFDALLMIAESYYHTPEIEHLILQEAILKKVGTAFNTSEVDLMLDYFVQHGILIRISREDESEVLPRTDHFYRITYQSIIEHILSEKIYQDIKGARIEAIPDILHKGIVQPLDGSSRYNPLETPPNQRIIQSIVNRLFEETGQLIGEEGFLTEGFSNEDILRMQFDAIRSAPRERAILYQESVNQMFLGDARSQFLVLKYLIVPSSSRAGSTFGSEYIHERLLAQPSAFERDKLWSGLDSFEAHQKKVDIYNNNVKAAINEYGSSVLILSEYEEYNARPLLYAWALCNIDQPFRNSLRVALTDWAIKRPYEFLKLLDKIFNCNDPQIQEDLASVMLGVASHVNDAAQLKTLAEWSLGNIFEKKEIHRNVVVRQGFRAVIEKAFLTRSISEEEVKKARPAPLDAIRLIDLEMGHFSDAGDGSYPITHDLAWYVIKNAYDHFLEYPSQLGEGVKDNACLEGKELLDLYREKYKAPDLFAHGWAMAAAIGYIRSILGLTRDDGSGWTEATHGSKSKVFTYEEKYTWLAVHYIQGYLSDYLPLDIDGERQWVKDYSKITDVPNPSEEVITDKKIRQLTLSNDQWMIKEDLASTIDLSGNINDHIKAWVEEEPRLNFSNWLQYDEKDFPEHGAEKKWLALRNVTSLEDASKAGFSQIVAIACLIKEDEFLKFKEIIESRDERRAYFITHLDGLKASPDTDTYSNPSDIVWMDWIEEHGDSERVYIEQRESKIFNTITELTQGTVEGEKYYKIPSKLIRKLLGIKSFSHSELMNNVGETVSFIHQNSEGSYRDSQEIVLVDEKLLAEKIKEQGLKLFWLVDFFKQKNPLNKSLDKNFHTQKSRKYLVWRDEINFFAVKFWDEYFSNQRDGKT